MTHKTTPKQVIMWQAMDGSLHRTEQAAREADEVYASLVKVDADQQRANRAALALEMITLEFDWYAAGRQLKVGDEVVPLKSICEWIHSYGHRMDDLLRMGAYYSNKEQ